MKKELLHTGNPLSYFYRDLEAVRELSRCVTEVKPETVVMEALDIARYVGRNILKLKPEMNNTLKTIEKAMICRITSQEEKFNYGDLLQLTLISKSFSNATLQRLIASYKMLLSVAHEERFLVDGILIFFSARKENSINSGMVSDEEIISEVEIAIRNMIRNLRARDEEYGDEVPLLTPYLHDRRRETEKDYVDKLERKLQEVLAERGKPIRKMILREQNNSRGIAIPKHDTPRNYGYKFGHSLYSVRSEVVQEPSHFIQKFPDLSQKAYALYISFQTMKDFRKYESIYNAMETSMKALEDNLEGKVTKKDVVRSLIRLATLVDDIGNDVLCYQAESFIIAMESILDKQKSHRAMRADLSASLEANYHIQSPRKVEEIVSYHKDSMVYMDSVMRNYDELLPVLEDIWHGENLVAETEAPYRPDMEEMDMQHLESGAENVSKAYEIYSKSSRSPIPLHDKLLKDSIDERLSTSDDIRYEIYSIVPDEEDLPLLRSMNFNIRDIF